ncbi:MAG: H/ACA ribonucleoprotein complex subunit GAR1 [Thermoplasmata archaeon]
MKRLGIVADVSYRGTLVIRAETAPRTGEEVFTSEGMHIGRVEKVFGPVSRPYVSVRPTSRKQKLIGIIGKELYLEEWGRDIAEEEEG